MNWELVNTIFVALLIYEIVRAILRAVLVVFLRRCFPSIYEEGRRDNQWN